MSKVRTLTNRLLVFLIFLLTGARVAIARIWPFSPPAPKPPASKVFALTEAGWLALRTMDGAGAKDAQQSQTTENTTPGEKDGNKQKPKSSDEKNAPTSAGTQQKPQSVEKKKPASPAATDKKVKSDEKNPPAHTPSQKGDKKNVTPQKPGVGGGDGDMDGGGG